MTTVPVAKTNPVKTKPPQIHNLKGGAIIVEHKEYIAEVYQSSANYAATKYAVNPGLLGTFPWLSRIAQNYESYRFELLDFIYEPTCSTTTAGTVILSIDTDAYDEAPVNKVQAMSYESATRSALWDRVVMNCKGNMINSRRYIRYGPAPIGGDLKSYDIGNFFLCTQGGSNGDKGELYVRYRVRLEVPQLERPFPQETVVSQSNSNLHLFRRPSTIYGSIGISINYGADPNVDGGDILTLSEPGNWLVTWWMDFHPTENQSLTYTPNMAGVFKSINTDGVGADYWSAEISSTHYRILQQVQVSTFSQVFTFRPTINSDLDASQVNTFRLIITPYLYSVPTGIQL